MSTDVPVLAHVVCDKTGTHAVTRVVRPQSDGVHVLIDNRGSARAFEAHALGAQSNQGGRLTPGGTENVRTNFGPGTFVVGCFASQAAMRYGGAGPRFARITVVDPQHLWKPTDLSCTHPETTRGYRIAGSPMPGEVAEYPAAESQLRANIPGIRASDEVTVPGYPETPWIVLPFTVTRSGNVVALMTVYGGEGVSTSKVDVKACSGFGIGVHPPPG